MKVLIIPVPTVPEYFNAGHRLGMFQTAAYLRQFGHEVTAHDIATLNATWRDVASLLISQQPKVVAILNDFNLLDGFGRTVDYIREFAPEARIITFGRLSSLYPAFFYQYLIDGVVVSGDYETGVDQFLSHLETSTMPAGVALRAGDQWIEPLNTGLMLPPDRWVMPNPDEIAYAAYDLLYSRDERKFCGIPERRELVVPMARGCPLGCGFCEVWGREGLKERRMSVASTLAYIEQCFDNHPFEYISFYAPTFTLKKKWVQELCQVMVQRGAPYSWKCTTTQAHLDEDLVMLMGRAGCVRISVGVEAFETNALEGLPGLKHDAQKRFDQLVVWCQRAGIELNAFVVVGLPGTTVEGTLATKQHIELSGTRFRPSVYSDYSLLHPNMSELEAVRVMSRHFLPLTNDFPAAQRLALYDLVFGSHTTLTTVMNAIAPRASTHSPSGADAA